MGGAAEQIAIPVAKQNHDLPFGRNKTGIGLPETGFEIKQVCSIGLHMQITWINPFTQLFHRLAFASQLNAADQNHQTFGIALTAAVF